MNKYQVNFIATKGVGEKSEVAKRKNDIGTQELATGQVSVLPANSKEIPAQYPKIADVLTMLNQTSDERDAIEVIVTKTPDGKAALNTYQRLANQGLKIEWFDKGTGKRTKKYDSESTAFCARMSKNNALGLDGVVDQLNYGILVNGGMAAEAVVSPQADDIEDVVVVDVATFEKFEWDEKLRRYKIYQKTDNFDKKVDLYEGNFFYIPNEPKSGRPDGTLHFEGAIYAISHYLKLMKDASAVLERIGYPRFSISIDDEKFYASLPAKVKADPELLKKTKKEFFDEIQRQCQMSGYNSDFISWSSVKKDVLGGNTSLGVDVRAWTEITNIEIPQAFTIPPIIMGRGQGKGSYALGTVEMEILVSYIESMRRASKRIIENIMNLWARTKGYNIRCKVTHNPIDWEKQIDKLTAQLKKLEFYRRLDEYGYIDTDEAARNTADVEKAEGRKPSDGSYAYLKQGSINDDANGTEPNGGTD